MAREKSPAFQFYPKDFLTDEAVRLMSHTERGIYITLLSHCWLEGSLPADLPLLAKMVSVPAARFEKLWQGPLSSCFHQGTDGRLLQGRLEQEREKQESFRKVQSEKGKQSALARFNRGSTGPQPDHLDPVQPDTNSPISDLHLQIASSEEREKRASLSPPADPFVNPTTTERAGRFLERYQELYVTHRHGARYALKPTRDYAAAVTLCHTWPDDARLDKLAVIFLTTDHKFAEEGSRTVPQFLALASWCDGKLAEHEARKARTA